MDALEEEFEEFAKTQSGMYKKDGDGNVVKPRESKPDAVKASDFKSREEFEAALKARLQEQKKG